MKKYLAIFLTAALCLSLAAACGNNSSTGNTVPQESDTSNSPTPPGSASGTQTTGTAVTYKDTIVIAQGSDQNYMDGQMNNTNDIYLRACYSQLVRRGPDNDIIGDLAESWDVSEDGLVWTFHLRKGVKFHSGKELTAADIKASYDRLLNQDKPVRYTALASGYLQECRIVDDYTVQLVTAKPIAPMLANLCHRSNLILNADYIERYGVDLGLTAESVDGTGPYRLAAWDPGQEMVLERFDEYYKGPVPTKTIDILIVSDASARKTALETGEVDITTVATSEIPNLMQNEDLKVRTFDSIGSQGLQFNCANEYMKDPRCRQAFIYAVDIPKIIETQYAVINETACTAPVNPNVWGYKDLGVWEYNPEKAKQLLAEAGYPDGFEILIQVYPSYNKSMDSTEMIVSYLAAVGIKAEIVTVDNATFSGSMGKRSFPGDNFPWAAFFMGYGAGTADCDEGLRRIWTTSPDGNNNNNYGWYSNKEVDELLLKAASEMDAQARLDLYARAQQIIYKEDPAALFLNNRFSVWSMSAKVEGFHANVNNVIFWDNLRCAE